MPAYTRESALSCAACEKLVYARVMSLNGGPLVTENDTWSVPRTPASTGAAAPLMRLMVEG
jgi:hypothetical protein